MGLPVIERRSHDKSGAKASITAAPSSRIEPSCLTPLAITPPPARPICPVFATAASCPRGSGRLLGMVDRAVVGYEPFFDIKLVVFPEFAHAAPIYETAAELSDRLAVPIPNEHTDRYVQKARERGVYHPDRARSWRSTRDGRGRSSTPPA